MDTQRIFVTGGTGFLGRHLVPTLCRAGYSLRILTRQPEENAWLRRYPRLEIVRGDVGDKNLLREALPGCRYIIHAGGLFRFWGRERDFQATNVVGTENLLQAAVDAGIEQFVHISTIAVIGHPDPVEIMGEDFSARPADAYQRSKLEAEQLALRYHADKGLPVVIVRPGAYYGPLGEYGFNRLFFRDPMRGITMQVSGGRYIMFPAYIKDVAQGVVQALQRGHAGEIYNLCGDWIRHKEAFDIIYEEAGLKWPRVPLPGWLGIGIARAMTAVSTVIQREPFWPINLRSYVYNYWRVSNEKARRELNFKPTDFRVGAQETIAWYRAGRPQMPDDLNCDNQDDMKL